MRTFQITMCFTVMMAVLSGDWVEAQSIRSQSVRQQERAARASWQPTRPRSSQPRVVAPRSHNLVSGEQVSSRRAYSGSPSQQSITNRLRSVHYVQGENIPVPVPEEVPVPSEGAPEASVLELPPEPAPLDGQVSLAPLREGTIINGGIAGGPIACDAFPGDPCGCGDVACDGCDSHPGCASGTCGLKGCSTCGELCSSHAWRPCITLCLPQDGWVSVEYLGWWQDGMNLPPLVTTSVDPQVARAQAGVLTSPTTQVLFGGGDVLDNGFDGIRLRFGVWLDRCHTWGLGAEMFKIGRESESFSQTSSGSPILARPFFNTQTGLDDAELIAFPNVLTGTVDATARSQFSGAGVHLRMLKWCHEGCGKFLFCGLPEQYCSRTEMLLGYRFLDLEEDVTIRESLVSTDVSNPGSFDIVDVFDTRNLFNGVDIGWMYRRTRGFWTFDATLRLAVGNSNQRVRINGQSTINDPNNTPQVQTLSGGLLAQTSNIGTYERNQFAVVPEFNTNVGYQLTDHFRVMFGYTFIYWSNVVRPGEQMDLDLNPNLLPPPADPFSGAQRPVFAFDQTDYWAQGLNFGVEYRW